MGSMMSEMMLIGRALPAACDDDPFAVIDKVVCQRPRGSRIVRQINRPFDGVTYDQL